MAETIFLSTVSNEYGWLRKELAEFLEATNLVLARHQDKFPASDEYTLMMLKSEIERSDVVVHIIGAEKGWAPPPHQVKELLGYFKDNEEKYGSFEERYKDAAQLARQGKLSATQWEAWIAVHLLKSNSRRPMCFRSLTKLPENGQAEYDDQQHDQLRHFELLNKCDVFSVDVANDKTLFKKIIIALLNRGILTRDQVGSSILKPNNLPSISLGNLFKGRDDFMERISEGLKKGAAAITAGNIEQIKLAQPTAIHGSGGIGKTRAAIEYAWKNQDRYTALLFIPADSPEKLRTSLAQLYGVLAIEGLEEATDDVRLAAVLKWLNSHPGWLAIVDNVDTKDARSAVMEQLTQLTKGHVLITSRLSRWKASVEQLDLQVLSIAAATQYLLESANARQTSTDDQVHAEAVAIKVGQLPLGLEHAKAYVNRLGIGFVDYLQQWERDESEILGEFDLDEIDYPRELLVTWKLSVDQLNNDARKLLEVLAWFAPEPIPESVLDNLPEDYLSVSARQALAELVDFSLVSRDTSEAERSFKLHRLVQATTRFHQLNDEPDPQTAQLDSLDTALVVVANAFDVDPQDVRNWPALEALVEHVQSICDFAVKHNKTRENHATSRLLNAAGLLYFVKGQFDTAEKNLRKALEVDEAAYGSNHPSVATQLINLAALLQDTNRLAEAEPLMRRALEIDEAAYGSSHSDVAVSLSNLAQLLKATNRLAEAEPLMRRALEIDEATYGSNHPNVAVNLNNLAVLLQVTNRLNEAEPLMRRALDVDEAAYGSNHPRVAAQLSNLAQLLKDTNRLKEAEPLMQRALEIDEAAYGSIHPRVAIHLNNLAQLLQATNRLKEAEPLMRRAMEIDESAYGSNHPRVARDLHYLAALLKRTNRLIEAEPLMQRAFVILTESYGLDHLDSQTAMESYKDLLSEMGKSDSEIETTIKKVIDQAS